MTLYLSELNLSNAFKNRTINNFNIFICLLLDYYLEIGCA